MCCIEKYINLSQAPFLLLIERLFPSSPLPSEYMNQLDL